MKYLKRFESSDRIYNIISNSVDEIRNVLIDFEDADIIKYNLNTLASSFTPKTIGIDDYIKHSASKCFILGNKRGTPQWDLKKDIIFKCEFKVSYKLNNTDLNDYSRDKYEDLLVCAKRIELMGYECSTEIKKYLPQFGNAILYVTIPI